MAFPLSSSAADGGSLPRSEEAERAVLGAVLLDPYSLPSVSARLMTADFFSDRHRVIYQAMLDLQEESVSIDLRTLQGRLEQRKEFEQVGGIAYLAALDLDLPDLSRVDAYVQIVKERSIRRRLIQASQQVMRDCLDGGLEAREALARAEGMIFSLGSEAVEGGLVGLGDIVKRVMVELEEREGAAFGGVATGFPDLDKITHGLHPGNLIIIAGRPGMGKTSFALNVAQNVALRNSAPVALFSLEMSEDELALRILCSEADVPFWRIRSDMLSARHWEQLIAAQKTVTEAPIFIDDSPNPTLLEISSRARRLKAEHGLGLLIVDYLQLMHSGGQYENRNLEVAAISRGFKQLAKELEIPVIALSQLSRQPERRGSDHRPQLADLRESGAIEQDADLVMFVYREEVYKPDDESVKNLAELIIAKHRNGAIGHVELVFLGETTSFRNLDRTHGHEAHGHD
jgi:replicative DNA helicase